MDRAAPSPSSPNAAREQYLRVRIKTLDVPPIKDGIVIGNRAAIGVEALERMLQLVSHEKFGRVAFPKDDVIGYVILRDAVLRKLSTDKFSNFVLRRIKPVMTDSEILVLDMDVEVVLEEKL